MRVFITGASGFIGRALFERYAADGHEMRGCDLVADRARDVVCGDVGQPGAWQDHAAGRRARRSRRRPSPHHPPIPPPPTPPPPPHPPPPPPPPPSLSLHPIPPDPRVARARLGRTAPD